MKTTTEDITLSLGLDDATLSPECTSTLIDLWLELQMTAVESVQAPTPNLFAFAETCFFFAVISENNKPEGARHANDPEVQRVQMQIDEEDFERVRRRSELEAYAQPRDGASSSAIPTEGAVRFASERSEVDPNAMDPSLEEHERKNLDPNNHSPTTEHYSDTWTNSATWNVEADSKNVALPASASNTWGSLPYKPVNDSSYGGGYSAIRPVPLPPVPSSDYDYNPVTPYSLPKAIGIVYLTCSPHENVPAGEANIGIILTPEARGKGFAKQAVNLVLTWVFDEIRFHRVQVGVLDSRSKDRTITLFTQMGFVHEGTRRRSVFCPNEGKRGAWKDVTYLALLETEWLMRSFLKPAPKNLWDEMFLRHAREREELLRWDDRQQRLNRTSSMETVRVLDTAPSEMAFTDDEAASDFGLGVTTPVRKGKMSVAASPSPSGSGKSNHSWESGGWESDDAEGHFQRSPFTHVPRRPPGNALSSSSSFSQRDGSPESVPRSISPSSSTWDMVETSSDSSSSFESLQGSDEE